MGLCLGLSAASASLPSRMAALKAEREAAEHPSSSARARRSLPDGHLSANAAGLVSSALRNPSARRASTAKPGPDSRPLRRWATQTGLSVFINTRLWWIKGGGAGDRGGEGHFMPQ